MVQKFSNLDTKWAKGHIIYIATLKMKHMFKFKLKDLFNC